MWEESYEEMRELLWEYLEAVITLLASEYSSTSGQSGPSSSEEEPKGQHSAGDQSRAERVIFSLNPK